jgi:hypothetical protein
VGLGIVFWYLSYLIPVLGIRIRKDPYHFGSLDPHPDPHQIKIRILIRIRINIYKPDPDPHHMQMSGQNVWNISLF